MTVIYLASVILGALGAWIMSYFAVKLRLIDFPNSRSSHYLPTPRGGGIGILAVFLLTSIYNGLPTPMWLAISALSILALLGDTKNLSPIFRLILQLFFISIFIIGTYHFTSNYIWCLLMVLFWTLYIAGTANFYNFMDGINGIAGITGTVGFALLAAYIHMNNGPTFLGAIAISISLSCLGFLPLNLFKARVFMGDSGSILLGGAFGGLVYLSSNTFLDFICLASFLFPFYADEITTMFIRWKDGERPTQAHRRHIYQLLANEQGVPHWQVSVGYGLLQLIIGISILSIKSHGNIAVIIILGFYFSIFVIATHYLRSSLRSLKSLSEGERSSFNP